MADLGELGVAERDAEPVEDVTFRYFGEVIRIDPAFGELDVIDFFDTASSVDATKPAQASGALKGVFRACIHDEDFDLFWRTARAHRQRTEDLMSVFLDVSEVITDRPTERPSDSSDGPQPTRATSAGGHSSLAVVRQLEDIGRPSIAVMVQDRADSVASA